MKRLISLTCLTLLFQQAFSQIETFDIISFKPPQNWKKDTKPGVVNYIEVNETKGKFCVITIYESTVSKGNAEKDFQSQWALLVATPYKAEATPKTQTQTTADGWKVVVAATTIKQDGVDVYMILSVFSGFGKTISVRSSLNNQSYSADIDALLATIKFDKTKTATVYTNPTTSTVQTPVSKGTFGLMKYTAPAGWSEQVFSDGVVFKPLDLPAGEHLAVQIMTPLNFSGTLEQAMQQSFDEAVAMYKATKMYQADGNYSKNKPTLSFRGWEYIRGKGGIQVENGTSYKTEQGLELFVVKVNNRFERVAILESRKYCGGVSRYYATDRVSYRNAIEELLFSLQFTDLATTVLQSGSAKGSGVTGLWQGTIQGTGAATGLRLEVFSPIFFTNGQVYFGPKFPTEGLAELNTRIPPELYPRNWGTYTFSNGSGVLKMPFADIPFHIQGDKILVTKNGRDWPLIKLPSVDGARFSGTYVMSKSYEMIPTITFTTDGKFTDKGVIRVLYHYYTDCVNPGFLPGSGTYDVKDYTVTFNYTDGRKVMVAFLGTGYNQSNPSPPVLRMSFNEDPMTRQ